MIDLLERLTPVADDVNEGETVYPEPNIRATAHRTIELPGGLLAVQVIEELHVSFVVFSAVRGPSTRDGVEVEPAMYQVTFCGEGPSGNLRELRHTYWGKDGYIFYVNAELITSAFAALREWFDCGG